MAARKTFPTRITDAWKKKIQTGAIIERVNKCARGEIDMTSVQMKAAEVLLKKVLPDMKQSDVNINDVTDYGDILSKARKRASESKNKK